MRSGYSNVSIDDHMKNNIVRFVDYVRLNRVLVMEYAAHGTLSDCGHYLSPQIYRLATQMTSAVSYFHGEEITHRDVKPTNILIFSKNPHFDFKLADFSVSSSFTNLAIMLVPGPKKKSRNLSKTKLK